MGSRRRRSEDFPDTPGSGQTSLGFGVSSRVRCVPPDIRTLCPSVPAHEVSRQPTAWTPLSRDLTSSVDCRQLLLYPPGVVSGLNGHDPFDYCLVLPSVFTFARFEPVAEGSQYQVGRGAVHDHLQRFLEKGIRRSVEIESETEDPLVGGFCSQGAEESADVV